MFLNKKCKEVNSLVFSHEFVLHFCRYQLSEYLSVGKDDVITMSIAKIVK